jgi:hypothetical protein
VRARIYPIHGALTLPHSFDRTCSSFSPLIYLPRTYTRTVPWDLAPAFDVFVAGAPTEDEKIHLFMPGHMTVFRHDPAVARAFFALEELASVDSYLHMPWILRPQWDAPGAPALAPSSARPALTADAPQRRPSTRTRSSCSPTCASCASTRW